MTKKILVRGPALSRSGYGEQTLFALRSLRSAPEAFDIYLINTNWGQTSWLWKDNEERRWIDDLLQKTIQYIQNGGKFDISLQVTIPNEWEKLAPVNIGYTAGIETTKISKEWIEKSSLMDRIIVISDHARFGFDNTVIDVKHPQTGQDVQIKNQTPIDVIGYPVREYEKKDLDLDLEAKFNFLCVAQWSQRKNLENTIRWFVEEFIENPDVGLVLKVSKVNNSIIDRNWCEAALKSLLSDYEDRKCKIQLLHGDMTEEEMTGLYNHKKIKAFISLAHGEGWGLPIFEAVYNDLPVIAPAWSGQCDYIFMPVKDKKGKLKKTCMISPVEFDIRKIQKGAKWDSVLEADSMWCFPKEWRYKLRLKESLKKQAELKSKAKKLGKYVRENFTAEKQYSKFVKAVNLGQEIELPEHVFVSDLFVEQYIGGAEMSLQALVNCCPSESPLRVNSSMVSKELIERYKDSKWIFGNIAQLDRELFKDISSLDYSFVEFDYKFCKHRNPKLYNMVEGEDCSYGETELGKDITNFINNASSVFFMSEGQREIYRNSLPGVDFEKTKILSSIFDDQILEEICDVKKKTEGQRTDTWVVLGSDSWVKGKTASKRWCTENEKEFEVVGNLQPREFLKKLSRSKGICFLPDGLDTCPRFVIEAKLLGCEMQLNDNVQHKNEEWFSLDDDGMMKYLRGRKDFFWHNAF